MPFRRAPGTPRRTVHMGIPVVRGTDALGASTANIHAEPQLLVDSSGLTPMKAITAATFERRASA